MPERVLLRRAGVEDVRSIARVLVASWRATYRDIVAPAFLASISEDEQAARWAVKLAGPDPDYCCVAVDEVEGLIGFASGGPDRRSPDGTGGELYAVHLLQPFQGRGLGRALVQTILAELHRRALLPVRVEVLAANPACAFYRKLGAETLGERSIELGGTGYPEMELQWSAAAVQALASRSAGQAGFLDKP